MNMLLVILSAFVANVTAYAQLSVELEPSYVFTSHPLTKASLETVNFETFPIFSQTTQNKAHSATTFSLFPYGKTKRYRLDYQNKLAIKFKVAQQTFVNIDNNRLILQLFIDNSIDDTPS